MQAFVEEKVKETNQKYLKELLGKEVPKRLEKQLETMDWSCLDLIHEKEQERGTFAPLGAMEIEEIEKNKEALKACGLKAIQDGKVGAILLAGGQGTRLGFDKAKGMYNIGITKELYIFEQLIEKILLCSRHFLIPDHLP